MTSSDPRDPYPAQEWSVLSEILPETPSDLGREQREFLCGLLRRLILQEEEEAAEALNVFRLEDIPALRAAVKAIPMYSAEEQIDIIRQLRLPPDEAGMEKANWAFRHQKLKGEILAGDRLIPFRLVRLGRHTYLLLALENLPDIAAAFCGVFQHEPELYTERVFRAAGQNWAAWFWFLDPDRDHAAAERARLQDLWRDMERE